MFIIRQTRFYIKSQGRLKTNTGNIILKMEGGNKIYTLSQFGHCTAISKRLLL